MKRNVSQLAAAVAVLASLAAPAFAADETPAKEVAISQTATPATLDAWKAMAAKEATVLAGQLGDKSGPWTVRVAAGNDSVFTGVFTKMLISELAAHGVQLSVGGADSASVIELQVDRSLGAIAYRPGTLSILTAEAWAVAGAVVALPPAGAATVLLVGADGLLSLKQMARKHAIQELALTLVASSHGRVAASNTNLYLIKAVGNEAYAATSGRRLNFTR